MKEVKIGQRRANCASLGALLKMLELTTGLVSFVSFLNGRQSADYLECDLHTLKELRQVSFSLQLHGSHYMHMKRSCCCIRGVV